MFTNGQRRLLLAQTPLLRFVVDLLYNIIHNSLTLSHSRLAIESRANYLIMLRYKSFI